MGRTAEEMEDVTLLGNKNVKYSMDYAPEMLQTFINKHQDNDYFCQVQLSGIYQLMSDHGTAGFCNRIYILCSGCEDGREQVFKIIFVQFQKSRRFP